MLTRGACKVIANIGAMAASSPVPSSTETEIEFAIQIRYTNPADREAAEKIIREFIVDEGFVDSPDQITIWTVTQD